MGATVGRGVVGRGRARHAVEAVERQGQLLPDERQLAAVGLRAVLLADGGCVVGHGLFIGGNGAQQRLGQRLQPRGLAEGGGQGTDLVAVAPEGQDLLQAQRLGQHLTRDAGVAVGVAADPAGHTQQRRDVPCALWVPAPQLVVQGLVDRWEGVEEHGLDVVEGALDLVDHAERVTAVDPLVVPHGRFRLERRAGQLPGLPRPGGR